MSVNSLRRKAAFKAQKSLQSPWTLLGLRIEGRLKDG
jgi:hypothetical protein